ncbi:MAG: hypothetical protein Kow006_09540 [Gammaproteobacteria bacterium]
MIQTPGKAIPVKKRPLGTLLVTAWLLFGVAGVQAAETSEMHVDYYHTLAREGSPDAQLVLGDHYRHGTDGVEKNLIEAYAWYYLAAQQGVEEAIKPMIDVLLELTPEEQHHAKEVAEEYAKRYVP